MHWVLLTSLDTAMVPPPPSSSPTLTLKAKSMREVPRKFHIFSIIPWFAGQRSSSLSGSFTKWARNLAKKPGSIHIRIFFPKYSLNPDTFRVKRVAKKN